MLRQQWLSGIRFLIDMVDGVAECLNSLTICTSETDFTNVMMNIITFAFGKTGDQKKNHKGGKNDRTEKSQTHNINPHSPHPITHIHILLFSSLFFLVLVCTFLKFEYLPITRISIDLHLKSQNLINPHKTSRTREDSEKSKEETTDSLHSREIPTPLPFHRPLRLPFLRAGPLPRREIHVALPRSVRR